MKKTVKASLSGISFEFEDAAYDAFKKYFDTLESAYGKGQDGSEIISDIEARITEIILSKQEPDTVIKTELANEIITRMGFPEGMEQAATPPLNEFPRRLYRNLETKRLGGVCSGLGTFFDSDPVWFRLAFLSPVILTILTGFTGPGALCGFFGTLIAISFLLYFFLWFAVPAARTPRQVLEMRGQKITAATIEQSFHQDFGDSDVKGKKSASVLASLVSLVGSVIIIFIKLIGLFVGIGLAVAAVGFLVAIIALMFGTPGWEGLNHVLVPIGTIPAVWFVVLILLIVMLPLVLLAYVILRSVFSSRSNKTFLSIIFGVWLITVIFTWVIGARNHENVLRNVDIIENAIEDEDGFDRIRRTRRHTIIYRESTPATNDSCCGDCR